MGSSPSVSSSNNHTCQKSALQVTVMPKHTSLFRKGLPALHCFSPIVLHFFTMENALVRVVGLYSLNFMPSSSLTPKVPNRKSGKNSDWPSLDHTLTSGLITVRRRRWCDWSDLDHGPKGWGTGLISDCHLLHLWVRVSLAARAHSAHEQGRLQVLRKNCLLVLNQWLMGVSV